MFVHVHGDAGFSLECADKRALFFNVFLDCHQKKKHERI